MTIASQICTQFAPEGTYGTVKLALERRDARLPLDGPLATIADIRPSRPSDRHDCKNRLIQLLG